MKENFNTHKPMTFGSMSLFVEGGELVLHRRIYRQGRMERGSSVESVANYYLNYESDSIEKFSRLAEMNIKHFESFARKKGTLKTISPEDREKMVDRVARDMAARFADNCDDDHDLSSEFCESAKNIGETLMKFHKAGFKTVTLHDSPHNLDVVMKSHRPKVA